MKKTLYLVRHGQTLFNLRHKIQGHCDSPLTELGIQQAQAVGKYLETHQFDHAYSSSSERACDTIELILNHKLPYHRLKGLKEMNFGTFEGESEDLNPKDRDLFNDFFVPYGGESQADVRKRMLHTLSHIMSKEDHHSVLVVSHAGASVAFLSHLEEPREVLPKGFPNGTILVFNFEDDTFTFKEVIYPTLD